MGGGENLVELGEARMGCQAQGWGGQGKESGMGWQGEPADALGWMVVVHGACVGEKA